MRKTWLARASLPGLFLLLLFGCLVMSFLTVQSSAGSYRSGNIPVPLLATGAARYEADPSITPLAPLDSAIIASILQDAEPDAANLAERLFLVRKALDQPVSTATPQPYRDGTPGLTSSPKSNPSQIASLSSTAAEMPTPMASSTATVSPTATVSLTYLPLPTRTRTPTQTTLPAWTRTPTRTRTATVIFTKTATQTFTRTSTMTATVSPTATVSSTATVITPGTAVPTDTATSNPTETFTATAVTPAAATTPETPVPGITPSPTPVATLPNCPAIDNGDAVLTSAADSYIASSAGLTGMNYGTAHPLIVRTESGGDLRALIRFDMPEAAPGTQVNRAVLYIHHQVGGAGGFIRFHQVTAGWDEGSVTWDSRPAYLEDPFSSLHTDNAGVCSRTVTIPTALVQGWLDGSIPNDGMMLIASEESGEIYVTSREGLANPALRPHLLIDYR